MAKKSNKRSAKIAPSTILNRRARFDYQLGEEVVAGLVLTGPEVRAAQPLLYSFIQVYVVLPAITIHIALYFLQKRYI